MESRIFWKQLRSFVLTKTTAWKASVPIVFASEKTDLRRKI